MMSRKFKNPLWEDPNTQRRVRCREQHETGSSDIIIDREDTETWDILMSQFTEEEITARTEQDIKNFREQRASRENEQKENELRMFQEALFAEKLQAFEIEDVKNSTNTKLKRKLRKAKTMVEVYAYAGAIVLDKVNNEPD